MDAILLEACADVLVGKLGLTYDIACKYLINLVRRLREYFPEDEAKALLNKIIRGFVPKFHLPAHGASCHTPWSLNYAVDVGRTDGEGVERDWAELNWLATQTFEMGPGARHQMLNDHFNHVNFRRVCGFGMSLGMRDFLRLKHFAVKLFAKRLVDALEWADVQRRSANAITHQYPEEIAGWQAMIDQYRREPRKSKDPWTEPDEGTRSERCRVVYVTERKQEKS
jgi:hypothetical protein